MRFTKMHGLGNDYVYVDARIEHVENPADLARRISDRHTGIGSDGLILIHPSTVADVRMEMYNADGSRGRMCGNGIRCVAKYAVEHGLAAGPIIRVETDSGIKSCECIPPLPMGEGQGEDHIPPLPMGEGRGEGGTEPRTRFTRQDGVRADSSGATALEQWTHPSPTISCVRVDMGIPSLRPMDLPSTIPGERIVNHPLRVNGRTFEITCVSMGNPHAVIFVDKLHAIDLVAVGPLIETASVFPERINVHFVRVDSPSRVTVRTWERGSGATRACGTGACAVCVAGVVTGRTARAITAVLPGGELEIEWAKDEHVYMTGEAVEVFAGIW
jgi:diaminopimelate epimerase